MPCYWISASWLSPLSHLICEAPEANASRLSPFCWELSSAAQPSLTQLQGNVIAALDLQPSPGWLTYLGWKHLPQPAPGTAIPSAFFTSWEQAWPHLRDHGEVRHCSRDAGVFPAAAQTDPVQYPASAGCISTTNSLSPLWLTCQVASLQLLGQILEWYSASGRRYWAAFSQLLEALTTFPGYSQGNSSGRRHRPWAPGLFWWLPVKNFCFLPEGSSSFITFKYHQV